MKKFLVFLNFILVLSMLVGCSQTVSKVNQDTIITSFDVFSISDGERKSLGEYLIEYDFSNEIITETKLYKTKINNELVDIVNTKVYQYRNNKLNNCHVTESKNGDLLSDKYYEVNSSDMSHRSVIIKDNLNNSMNKTQYFPSGEIPISINTSSIFEYGLLNKQIPESKWFAFDVSGNIDVFETKGSCEYTGYGYDRTIECTEVSQIGMFDTTYLLNENGIIVSLEQIMDDDYTVCMELKELK